MDVELMREELAHVYWLGGSACAGKSSVAEALVKKHGWQLYLCDEGYERHVGMVIPERQPMFAKVSRLRGDELWMRPVEQQVREMMGLYAEEFALIIEDVLALPKTVPILVEGNALMPELVAPVLANVRQALWMVPVAEFQLKYYAQRQWVQEVLADCTWPDQAFANWMRRDMMFAEHVAQSAEKLGLKMMWVDEGRALDKSLEVVDEWFGGGVNMGIVK